MSADGNRDLLRILDAQTFTLTGKSQRIKTRHTERKPETQRLSSRWPQMLEYAAAQLGDEACAVQVCNREADSYVFYERANGPPGWQTLGKGLPDLLMLAEGALLAGDGFRDQS